MSARSSSPSALLAPFTTIARDLLDLVRNPTAFAGGLAGSAACMTAAVALALSGVASGAQPDDDGADDLDMEFLAGVLVRKGIEIPPDEKVVVDAQKVPDGGATTTVTTDQNATPDPTPKPPKPKPPARDPHDPNAHGRDSDHNTPGNNPYNDHPTAPDVRGDPFAPDGWADMARDGDPWATAVLKALNNLTVGSYAGLGQDVTFKFQLVICADGRIDRVNVKQSTGAPDFDGRIRNAVEVIKMPKAPDNVAKQLAGGCKKIPYIFTWSGRNKGHVE